MKTPEGTLSSDELDVIFASASIVKKSSYLPPELVQGHLDILGFFLDNFPIQSRTIIEMVANINPEGWS